MLDPPPAVQRAISRIVDQKPSLMRKSPMGRGGGVAAGLSPLGWLSKMITYDASWLAKLVTGDYRSRIPESAESVA
jgi:hypothetical protein